MIYIFYRGPLERSRLGFLLELFLSLGSDVNFFWLLPHPKFYNSENQVLEPFMSSFPGLEYKIIPAPLSKIYSVRSEIKKIVETGKEVAVVSIGFTAPYFLPKRIKANHIWCINGIPEESLLHTNSWLKRLQVKSKWKTLAFQYKPDLILTVSKRMNTYVSGFFPGIKSYAIPLCVDLDRFKRGMNKPKYYTYSGSGAPWQNLGFLSLVWTELHRLDPAIKFRVISRDSRTKVLATGIPKESIEFVGTSDLDELADFLSEAKVGFLLREDSLVNRVSFPTKLSEYLASGSWVVVSDLDWDISEIVSDFKVGVLVSPKSTPKQIASYILSQAGQFEDKMELNEKLSKAIIPLGKSFWIEKGRVELKELMKIEAFNK